MFGVPCESLCFPARVLAETPNSPRSQPDPLRHNSTLFWCQFQAKNQGFGGPLLSHMKGLPGSSSRVPWELSVARALRILCSLQQLVAVAP